MTTKNIGVRFSVKDSEVVKKALKDLGAEGERALKAIERGTKGPSAGLKTINSAAREARSSLENLSGRAGVLGRVLASIGPAGLAAGVALGSVGGGAVAALKVLETAAALQATENRLKFLTGSAGAASEAMAYVAATAQRQSVDINALGDAYGRLQVFVNNGKASVSEMRSILEGMNDLAKVHGTSAEQLGFVYYGLAQALGSATVQMQEVNQVTEPVPGLLDAIAKAAGVTSAEFRKMVADSKISATDFKKYLITALDQTRGAAERMGDSFVSAQTRSSNSMKLLSAAIADAGLEQAGAKAFGGLANWADYAAERINIASRSFQNLSNQKLGDEIARVNDKILQTSQLLADLRADDSTLVRGAGGLPQLRGQEIKSLEAQQRNTLNLGKQLEDQLKSRLASQKEMNSVAAASVHPISNVVAATEKGTKATKEAHKAFKGYNTELDSHIDKWKKAQAAAFSAAEEQREAAQRAQEELERPFIQAAENIQNAFADTFADILTNGIDSFSDLGAAIKRIMAQTVAQSLTAKAFSGGISGSSSGGGGGFGFNPLSMFSNAIGSTAIGAGINAAGASFAPSLFATGAPIGAAVGPTQLGSLAALGLTPATLALGAVALLPTLVDAFKSRPHPASTFGGTLTGGGAFDDLAVKSKHIDDSYGQGAADALASITAGLAGLGLTGFAGKAVTGGVDDGNGFLTVGGQTVATFNPNDAKAMEKALLDAALAMVDLGSVANDDLLKALKGLKTEGKDAATVLQELTDAAARPGLRAALNQQVGDAILGSRSQTALALVQLDREFASMRDNARNLGADLAAVEELYAIRIKDAVRELAEQQLQAAETAATQWRAANDNIRNYRTSLLVGALSPLSPEGRLSAARGQFKDVAGRAQSGDIAAIEQLQGVSQTFLEASRDYFASSEGYVTAFNEVQGVLSATESVTARQLREAEKQTALLQQIAAANGNAPSDGKNPALNRLLRAATGFTGDFGTPAQEFDKFVRTSAVSESQREVARQLIRQFNSVPGFASGGVADGWAWVGEHGRELINVGKPSRVYSASESSAMVANDNVGTIRTLQAGFKAMVGELQELRKSNAEIRGYLQRVSAA